jgi:CRISPR/Cas system-associated exonuclease Cas4 (RecB family)
MTVAVEKPELKIGSLPKEHISVTQLNMFLRCPRQYMYRYMEGIKCPPSGELLLGSAGHTTIAHNYQQKIETKKDLKTKEVLEFFAEEFDQKVKDEGEINWKDEKPGDIKDNGTKVLKVYQETHAKTIQPKEVEKEFNIEFEDTEFRLKGFMDLITEPEELIDHKISGKTPSQSSIDNEHQMTVYKLGYRLLYGKDPKKLRYDYLLTLKTPQVKPFETQRTDEDIEEMLTVMSDVVEAIKTGSFYRQVQGWQCNQKYCGYFGLCRPHRLSKLTIL